MKNKLLILIFVLGLSLGFLPNKVLGVGLTTQQLEKICPAFCTYCHEIETGIVCSGIPANINLGGMNATELKSPELKDKCICGPIPPIEPMELIDKVINWIFWIILIGSSFMVVVGALFITMAAGKPEIVTKGKSIITWALIGLAIVASARLLSAIIIRILSPG